MRPDEVALYPSRVLRIDPYVGKISDAGTDAVHGLPRGYGLLDNAARRRHAIGDLGCDVRGPPAGDGRDILEREIVSNAYSHGATIRFRSGREWSGMRAIRAALVHDGDGFVEDSAVLIEGGWSRGIVDASRVPEGAEIEDWGEVAIVPGTVNSHGHAFQNLFKGFGDDRSFDSWRDDVLYPFSERLTAEDIYTGALFAFAEALLAGVTTTVDFFYLHDEGNDNALEVVRAARDVGIRLVFARAFYDSDAPTKAPARYREDSDSSAKRCIELANDLGSDPMISVQPAPHSLHAATPETVAAALDVAGELDVPCHLHLAEASYEVDLIRERYGTTPVRLLQREGLLVERLVTIHTVWVDDEELDMIAEAEAAVVHCPGANAFLGDGIARLPEMLDRGIRVALGPDGGCANNRQSVFDEMRMAALLAKARLTNGAAMTAAQAFALGTRSGGDVLGLPVGSLEAGAAADLVALDLADISLLPRQTATHQVVYSMQPTAITRVMVGGEVVMDEGELTKFPLEEIEGRVRNATTGWIRP
jgi:5-methylthioadenosine/S-adenosylhomocysteine deaminase